MLKKVSIFSSGYDRFSPSIYCSLFRYDQPWRSKVISSQCTTKHILVFRHRLSITCELVAKFFKYHFDYKNRDCNTVRHKPQRISLNIQQPNYIQISASEETIAQKLTDEIRSFMSDFGVPNGLSALGFSYSDIDTLSDAAVNSLSAVSIAPRATDKVVIADIYEKSMQVF